MPLDIDDCAAIGGEQAQSELAALRAVAAELADDLVEERARVESLQAKWANRPIGTANEEAICAENDRLRAALTDVMPLLAECDCIYSDRDSPLCPCRAARAALG
jgi:hypothetical protein